MNDIYMSRESAIRRLKERKDFLIRNQYNIPDRDSEIAAIDIAIKDIQRAILTDSNVSITGTPWR